MTGRRWLRMFFIGLVCTLVVAMYLFSKIQPNRNDDDQKEYPKRTNVGANTNGLSNSTKINMAANISKAKEINMSRKKTQTKSPLQQNRKMLRSNLMSNASQMLNSSRFNPGSSILVPKPVASLNPSIVHINSMNPPRDTKESKMHLVIACCLTGEDNDKKQLALTKTFLKSLFTFNRKYIHLHVYVLPNHQESVINLVNGFQSEVIHFDVNYYNSSMPDINIQVKHGPIWTKNVTLTTLFKPCSAQRLFLPYSLPDLDKVLYMDTDTLILGPLDKVSNSFQYFNESQLYGMSFIARHAGFYDARPYRQPYKGKTGHNAGVMLMDLTKLRRIDWYNITLDIIANLSGPNWAYAGDQDIFNYYNGLHPNDVYEMSCAFNWRWSYCRPYKGYPQECVDAHEDGISIIHGVSGTFFKRSYFPMRLYKIFAKYDMATSIEQFLIEPIKEALVKYKDYICGKVGDIYYKQMARYIQLH